MNPRPNPKKRRLWRYLFIALVLPPVLLLVASWVVGGQLITPKNKKVGPPPEGLNFHEVTIVTEPGLSLAGWYADTDQPDAVIVLLHPLHGNRSSMLSRATFFIEHGFSVVMIDLRGHGESPGDSITAGYLEKHDVAAAVDFARAKHPAVPVVIDGWSLGGAAAVLGNAQVDGMILESVFPTIREAVSNRIAIHLGNAGRILTPLLVQQFPLRLGISVAEVSPIEKITDVKCPTLFLVGQHDRHTTLAESQRLYERANAPKSFVVFENAAHADLYQFNPELFEERVLDFLQKLQQP